MKRNTVVEVRRLLGLLLIAREVPRTVVLGVTDLFPHLRFLFLRQMHVLPFQNHGYSRRGIPVSKEDSRLEAGQESADVAHWIVLGAEDVMGAVGAGVALSL